MLKLILLVVIVSIVIAIKLLKTSKTESQEGVTITTEVRYTPAAKTALDIHNAYASKSKNPKFHRSAQEKELSTHFHLDNHSTIEAYENQIYNDGKPFNNDLGVLDCITACNSSLSAYNSLKQLCYRSEGGKIYFQDRWEYCHNSKTECFAWSDSLQERLEYLNRNKSLLLDKERKLPDLSSDLLDYLKTHKDVIQKDIYADFNPLLKSAIQQQIREFEKSKIITRTKYKNSYKIEVV